MAALSRSQQIIRWARHHPKTSGIGVLLIVALVLGGVFGDSDKNGNDPSAAAGSQSPAPTATSASKSSSPLSSSTPPARTAAGSASAAASPTRVSAAPADRSQRSTTLASTALAALAIKGRAPKTGYSRAQFGTAWIDDNDNPLGRNGCDTRNDILRRDLTAVSYRPGSNDCAVMTGTLRDPYTNRSISFQRGETTSSAVQIDHVVALSDAWQKGAQRYDARTRANLANDPLNLLAVDGPANSAKGDGDAATWLPPNKSYRCAYVARQIAVKSRYRLWMTSAERDAAARVLTSCPRQTVPAEAGTATINLAPKPTPRPLPTKTRTRRPAPPVTPEPPTDVYYENCDAVRAAGAAPIRVGDPGYDSHLDRDSDGVGCE